MERVLEKLVDMRPPLCMRRFMSSDPTLDKNGWYPISLLQSYPEVSHMWGWRFLPLLMHFVDRGGWRGLFLVSLHAHHAHPCPRPTASREKVDTHGPCDNARGDLIYGHIPLDAVGAATHWLKRPLPRYRMCVRFCVYVRAGVCACVCV